MQAHPIIKDLVLLGGGHSHVTVLKRLGMSPLPGLQITLISPNVCTPYSGMLPGFIAGHYSEEQMHIDLVALCRFAGARLILDQAIGLDAVNQRIQTINHPDIAYDVLSIDIGITPSLNSVPGAAKNVITVKPIHRFIDQWAIFTQKVRNGEIRKVGVVGGGAGGVELCLAIEHRLSVEREIIRANMPDLTHDNDSSVAFHLFSDGPILQEYSEAVRQTFGRLCERRGIQLHDHFRVNSINNKEMSSDTGEMFSLDEIFWVTTAASQDWLRASGLSCDEDGFVKVHSTLQTFSHPNVFAVGDIAEVADHPRPKAGVFAVRQGPPLERNIRRLLQGKQTKPFKPQMGFLSLISTGDKYAIASKGRYKAEGSWVWYWKDRIDRGFMDKFNRLPAMKKPKTGGLVSQQDDELHCGGCGAKLNADMLAEVLSEIKDQNGDDIIIGVSDGDDAAVVRVPAGQVLVQTTDHFRSFVEDPYIFAKIGVCHALNDIYAMGVLPKTVLATVILPFGRPGKLQEILRQIMLGAVEALNEDGVALIGGHTGEGVELSLGFTVNGYAKESDLWCKGGMQEGDLLILTRSLGTGALFAADMQYQAKGRWIREALDQMQQSNRQAMEVFKEFNVRACTDITGFGLAGHLLEMLKASTLDAEVRLNDLPVMAGASEVINQLGIKSSLHFGNQQNERSIITPSTWQDHKHYGLLFDPQTSGGLLAAVNPAQVLECIGELFRKGYTQARIIGQVVSRSSQAPQINLTTQNA